MSAVFSAVPELRRATAFAYFSVTSLLCTLYYFPKELICYPSWRGHRSQWRTVEFTHPVSIHLERTKGDGRVGNDPYKTTAQTKDFFGLTRTTSTFVRECSRKSFLLNL
jgi:hypothetical protein